MTKKVILITGASSGFGKLTAQKLLAEGQVVYAAARRTEMMDDLKKQGAHILKMDVTNNESVEAGVAQIIAEQKRIDVVFNNAGFGLFGATECLSMEDIKAQYEVNVFGVGRVLHAVLPHMRAQKQGTIINTASAAGHISTLMMGWYASTKHALEGISDALRQELKPLGIHVVLIEPGPVKTEFEDIAAATLHKTPHHADYQTMLSAFAAYMKNMYATSPGPESTVRCVLKAINAKKPKARYATTPTAKYLPTIKRLMGTRLFDAGVLFEMKRWSKK